MVRQFLLLIVTLSLGRAALLEEVPPAEWGGGPPPTQVTACISPAQRAAMAKEIEKNLAAHPRSLAKGTGMGPQPYPFQPLAGNIWQDRFICNFVDLDDTTGIRDWDCTGFTYDGHQGHDILLHSFGEMDVGSPVFAALDGTVVALHDGEFDRNTTIDINAMANYVALDHGNGHITYYGHFRKNSVAVSLNQFVKAGTQLGLVGSSGYSTGPHLHFESQLNNEVYEPYAGACQTNTPCRWVTQTPIPRNLSLDVFAMHGTNFNNSPFLPENPVRQGTFVRTGGVQPMGCWFILRNQPANSTWRLRYLRPNGTQFLDSGTQNFNNATPNRFAPWWLLYNLNPDAAGTWNLQLYISGQLLVTAPFIVLNSGGVPTNQPPATVNAAFDPPVPGTNDVVFCRLNVPLLSDPDYDFVRYRYLWKLNGSVIRDVTNAAYSDAVPRSTGNLRDLLSCTVTPLDGKTNGPSATVSAFIGGAILNATRVSSNSFRLTWPTSGPPYTLEYRTNLAFTNWQIVATGISQVASENTVTNPGTGNTRVFRLRFNP